MIRQNDESGFLGSRRLRSDPDMVVYDYVRKVTISTFKKVISLASVQNVFYIYLFSDLKVLGPKLRNCDRILSKSYNIMFKTLRISRSVSLFKKQTCNLNSFNTVGYGFRF